MAVKLVFATLLSPTNFNITNFQKMISTCKQFHLRQLWKEHHLPYPTVIVMWPFDNFWFSMLEAFYSNITIQLSIIWRKLRHVKYLNPSTCLSAPSFSPFSPFLLAWFWLISSSVLDALTWNNWPMIRQRLILSVIEIHLSLNSSGVNPQNAIFPTSYYSSFFRVLWEQHTLFIDFHKFYWKLQKSE